MINEKVYEILNEVLGLDEEEVKINEDLDIFDDLAAESIDLVDICFGLEREFELGQVNPGDIFPGFLQEKSSFDESGNISASAINRLEKEYPHTRGKLIGELIKTKEPSTFLKVKNLVEFVEYRLGQI